MTTRRRFPPPWTIEETNDACFIVRDKNGRALEFFGGSVGAFAAVLPDEISDPPHYCIDDRQHRDHVSHRQQPSIATTIQSLLQLRLNTQSTKALFSPSKNSPAKAVKNCRMSPIQSGQKYLMTGSINNPRRTAAYRDKTRPLSQTKRFSGALVPRSKARR